MKKIDKAFGFYPKPIRVCTGPINIEPLSEFDECVEGVFSLLSERTDKGWIYAPPILTRDIMSGETRKHPSSARVFCLPKTHLFKHAKATGEDHVEFHIWALSFFLGMRLTVTEAGFLDATPIKPGNLVDFNLLGQSLKRAIELAEQFWIANCGNRRNAQRFKAAVHALFLSQYPQALPYEEFIHLYIAIDTCYALTKALRSPKAQHRHSERIEWMCGELGVKTPPWAQTSCVSGTVVPDLRNDALHEALFVGEPLGFAVYGGDTGENIALEMNALICRLLVALLGGNDNTYLGSHVNTRQRYGLRLV